MQRTVYLKKSVTLILFLNVIAVYAQEFVLKIQNTDKVKSATPFFKPYQKSKSRLTADSALASTITRLVELSFVESSIDSINQTKDTLTAFIHTGNPYQVKVVKIYDGINSSNLLEINYNQTLLFQNLDKLMKTLLNKSINNGYPFTKVFLDSVKAFNNMILTNIYIDKGVLVFFDTIKYIGSEKISKRFLQNYLRMRPGLPYSEEVLSKSFDKIKALGIVMPIGEIVPFFADNKCTPVTNLKYLARDEARALIGLNQDEISGKARLSGEAYLHLHNLFYSAREFEFIWQSWKPGSQLVKLNAVWPFPLNSPFILKAGGGLMKYDTLFTKLHSIFSFAYPLNSMLTAGVGLRSENTILTFADTTFVRNTMSLPENVGLNQRSYFIDLTFKRIDFEPNPLSGFLIKLIFSASDRKIKKDSRISQVVFRENGKNPYTIYDSLDRAGILRNNGFELDYSISKFNKISTKSTFLISIEGKVNKLPKYYLSDLYRIGGNISLRGFNEQSIFATTYHFMNLEWRYLFGERSFASLFYNIATIENNSGYGSKGNFNATGFGTCVKFSSNSSTFTIAYALGKEKNNKFEFRNAKIHIGVINNF